MDQSISRRGLIAGGAAASLAALGPVALGMAEESLAASADYSTQALVIGGGFGGLCATAHLAYAGLNPILIEASVRCGGAAFFCSGTMGIGTNDITWELILQNSQFAEPALSAAYMEAWDEFGEWLQEETDAPAVWDGKYVKVGGDEFASPEGNIEFAKYMVSYIEENGGTVLTQTRGFELITNESGAVIGAKAYDAEGKIITFDAANVVLYCGGYAAHKGLLESFMSPYGSLLGTRTSPFNDGAGLRMGLSVGGKMARGMSSFYGHHIPYPWITTTTPEEWNEKIVDDAFIPQQQGIFSNIQSWGKYCIYVNQNGLSYGDEALGDNVLCQLTAQQKWCRAFVILDQNIRENKVGKSKRLDKERIEIIKDAGGTVLEAETLEELAQKLFDEWKVPKANLLRTVAEYNEAAKAGTAADLVVPKNNVDFSIPIEEGPFYAVVTVPGISTNYGGLVIDTSARVLGANDEPIPGLYAEIGTAGGLTYDGNIGALSSIISFAWLATRDIIAKSA